MIISASRRTDIPAFYTRWFMNRIQQGYCTVPNPFNRKQVSRISLDPSECSVIVFWTRYADPLLPYFRELDDRGYRYYFLYTLMDNPRNLEPRRPAFGKAVRSFLRASEHVGPDRMIWRYDPIVVGRKLSPDIHLETFHRISALLKDATRKCVVSFVDIYRKNRRRMAGFLDPEDDEDASLRPKQAAVIEGIAEIARNRGLVLNSCAETMDLRPWGVEPGKCIDDRLIARVFGIHPSSRKDPSQRKACRCVVSKDIGSYDTCLFGCRYCYATSSFEVAAKNHATHNPNSPSLLGWYDVDESSRAVQKIARQRSLWDDQE